MTEGGIHRSPPQYAEGYGVFEEGDGSVVVYVEGNEDAWLRSDLTVPFER